MKAILLIKITFAILDLDGRRRHDVEGVLRHPLVFKEISAPTLEHLKPGSVIQEMDMEYATVTEIVPLFDGKTLAPLIKAELALSTEEFSDLTGYTPEWLAKEGGAELLLLSRKNPKFIVPGFVIGVAEKLVHPNRRLEETAKSLRKDGFDSFQEIERQLDLSENK